VHAVHGSEAPDEPEQPDVYDDPPHGCQVHENVVEKVVRVKEVPPPGV
jgi:hypothetical protein